MPLRLTALSFVNVRSQPIKVFIRHVDGLQFATRRDYAVGGFHLTGRENPFAAPELIPCGQRPPGAADNGDVDFNFIFVPRWRIERATGSDSRPTKHRAVWQRVVDLKSQRPKECVLGLLHESIIIREVHDPGKIGFEEFDAMAGHKRLWHRGRRNRVEICESPGQF